MQKVVDYFGPPLDEQKVYTKMRYIRTSAGINE